MFATALVASVAAFADAAPTAINAINFAGYATGATFQNYDPEFNSEENTGPFFYFQGDAGVSNSSVVTNESASANHTAFFADATDSNYLALDTEGGTFWRGLNQAKRTEEGETVTYGLGDPRAIAATGTYLDTLVQFTVTEDDAPTTTADDKLAIWLGVVTNAQGEVTGTNLMVKAKTYIADIENSTLADAVTTYSVAVSGITIEAGTWYRLTVKAIPNLLKTPEYGSICGFQIYIDGQPAKNKLGATFNYANFQAYDMISSEMATLMAEGSVFASLGALDDTTLQGVGFQGTGAVDEIVWTEDDLFPAGGQTGIDFTLTWGEGVSAVKYVLSTDTATTNALTSGTAVQLAAGDGTATIELIPTFASGYEFDKVTMGEDVISSLTFPIPGVTTNATLYAKAEAPAYPTYVGEDAALKTQYDAWKNGKTVGDGESYEKQFLLNTATDTVVADDALQIDSITEVQGGWDIVVSTTVTGAALSDGSATTYNGYLLVKSADTLAGLEAATPASYTVTPAADGKVKITVTAGKFMKVVLTTTAPAQN